MKNLFPIGEVATIKDITIKSLRYYHQVGILTPRHIDETTGYRYYSMDQFIHIDIIKGCRALGTSIKELQEIFTTCDTEQLLIFLASKRKNAEETITNLQKVIGQIDTLTSSVIKGKDMVKETEVKTHYFEERQIVIVPCQAVGNHEELLYYSKLEKLINEKYIGVTAETGMVYDKNLHPLFVFKVMETATQSENKAYIKTLPQGNYVTITYTKETEDIQREKLDSYLQKHNLHILHYLEVDLLNDFFNTELYSCQIQVYIGS